MRRTEQVQGLRLMKFEEVYGRTHRGGCVPWKGTILQRVKIPPGNCRFSR